MMIMMIIMIIIMIITHKTTKESKPNYSCQRNPLIRMMRPRTRS